MKFEGELLSQLGYKLCKQCEKEYYKNFNEKSLPEKIKIEIENKLIIDSDFELYDSEKFKDVKLIHERFEGKYTWDI